MAENGISLRIWLVDFLLVIQGWYRDTLPIKTFLLQLVVGQPIFPVPFTVLVYVHHGFLGCCLGVFRPQVMLHRVLLQPQGLFLLWHFTFFTALSSDPDKLFRNLFCFYL
jgi:hypothetical protein